MRFTTATLLALSLAVPANGQETQRRQATDVPPGEVYNNSIGMEFVPIQAGRFLMGSPDGDPEARASEKPQREVKISRPFQLGRREVTQEQ